MHDLHDLQDGAGSVIIKRVVALSGDVVEVCVFFLTIIIKLSAC